MSLTIKRIKEILGDESLPDSEVEVIRSEMEALVDVIYSQWTEETQKSKSL